MLFAHTTAAVLHLIWKLCEVVRFGMLALQAKAWEARLLFVSILHNHRIKLLLHMLGRH